VNVKKCCCKFNIFVKKHTITAMRRRGALFLTYMVCLSFGWFAQQVPDTAFQYPVPSPAYPYGTGPMVLIDRGHNNFHTRSGGFRGFASLLEQDGYHTGDLNSRVTGPEMLNGCRILVIANALDSSNLQRWILPTTSAFGKEEIERIRNWVREGGSLLLIADHMPFAGAANKLARAFGFEYINGFAFTGENTWPPSVFSRRDSNLRKSPVTDGFRPGERIDSLVTFTGSAFYAPDLSTPILCFKKGNESIQPDTAWRFNLKTPREDLKGYFQGAVMKVGKGRIAVFGEAAMFTAQLVNGTVRVGFNSELAPQNGQFILNLVHWLDGWKP
jgi:hypothetical protein